MCLHFHPMAVSRWFSAASLKQVSNMAITGSGSLAISFYVLVISAAFLHKGELVYSSPERSSDGSPPSQHSISPTIKKRVKKSIALAKWSWCVCAHDAHQLLLESQHPSRFVVLIRISTIHPDTLRFYRRSRSGLNCVFHWMLQELL